jgi:hypothetical protein
MKLKITARVNFISASNVTKHSALRRKTNTYAKKKSALQCVLDGYWIVHNFINEHVSTKQIPAVFFGIIERGLTWEEVLKVQHVV